MPLLDDVKKACRVSHTALDTDIDDLISAARQDLKLSGISSIKADAEADIDPLIKRSIIVYVKSQFEADAEKADRFQKAYEMLKAHLSLAGDYMEVVTTS
jgi:uncharacterized phage protein (predicted DNA packaging)